jgi:phosphoribosylformimino-5-aminoimidazole carboxamide ribotide isomerase
VDRGLTSNFEILPAIDLRGGRVVRLLQGDFERETSYSEDPVAVAVGFVDAGARWLHIVDLDGARTGEPAHSRQIQDVIEAVGDRAALEVAGGLRTAASVASVLAAGAARAVVGTAALRDPTFAGRLIATYGPDRVCVALDVRDGLAVGEGWRESVGCIRAEDALDRLADKGVTTFEATAIDRDGLLSGPNLALLTSLVANGRGEIIASGGFSSIDDLRAVRAIGCTGAIVGRALYEGRLDLAQAITG